MRHNFRMRARRESACKLHGGCFFFVFVFFKENWCYRPIPAEQKKGFNITRLPYSARFITTATISVSASSSYCVVKLRPRVRWASKCMNCCSLDVLVLWIDMTLDLMKYCLDALSSLTSGAVEAFFGCAPRKRSIVVFHCCTIDAEKQITSCSIYSWKNSNMLFSVAGMRSANTKDFKMWTICWLSICSIDVRDV